MRSQYSKPTEEQRKACGVPYIKPVDRRQITAQAVNNEHFEVSVVAQEIWWKKTLSKPFGNYLYVIGSIDPMWGRDRALELFEKWWMHKPEDASKPQWICLWNEISTKRTPAGVVIEGLGVSSSQYRLQVVYDLLNAYEDKPRVLLVNADDPSEFCRLKLGIHIDRILKLGPNRKVVRI